MHEQKCEYEYIASSLLIALSTILFSQNVSASNFKQFMSKGGSMKSQTFTTSGTWTRPPGVTFVSVEVQGAGGGGGGGGIWNGGCAYANQGAAGGGGGGAGAFIVAEKFEVTGDISVVIGTGGPRGIGADSVNGSGYGRNQTGGQKGGQSCFGTLCAEGGPGGSAGGSGSNSGGFVGGGGLGSTAGVTGNSGQGQTEVHTIPGFRSVVLVGGAGGGFNSCSGSSSLAAGKAGHIPGITAAAVTGPCGGAGAPSVIASAGKGGACNVPSSCVADSGGIGAGGGGGGPLMTATPSTTCNGGTGGGGQVRIYWTE